MFSKKRYLGLLVVGIMAFSLMFTGCQQTDEVDDVDSNEPVVAEEIDQEEAIDQEDEEIETVEEDQVQLSDWNGSWNNMAAYAYDEELEQAFKDLAENEGISVDEAKESFTEGREINFDGFVVEGNKVTLLDGFEDKDGQVLDELEFEYKETVMIKHGDSDSEWFVFESDEDGEYKYLVMMHVHGEETMAHFHVRHGNDMDEILASEGWYPTFIKPTTTYEQLYGRINR